MPADVQVTVRFKERCVFAGEELNCIITFRNHVDLPEAPPTPGLARNDLQSGRGGPPRRGHNTRRSFNLGTPRSRHRASFSLTSPPLPKSTQDATTAQRPDFKHQRAVSIVSVNAASLSSSLQADSHYDGQQNPRGPLGHRRSSTIQVAGDTSKRLNLGARQLSTDPRASTREGRKSPLSSTHSPASEANPLATSFKFPPNSQTAGQISQLTPGFSTLASASRLPQRIFSNNSNTDSNRNSIDLYNHSNNSGETLMSEQPSMIAERPHMPRNKSSTLQRSGSLAIRRPQAVRLLMGYAQIGATFTLDSSLVDQTPFEEVKRKGFLGGQAGGGVVGVKKKARPSSGLFGAFNFSSLGESLDSILGGDNLSSVKEMKAVTNSRAIPLLSTPQSLLFVDLFLEPGEERSYSFSYRLPKGLPSSYKGKAIKIVYNLTIGVQGSPGKREMQAVRQVNIPIRVFSGVDIDGEIFGHDLMQPYVILQDTAKTKLLAPTSDEANPFSISQTASAKSTAATTSAKEFLRHVDSLLEVKRRRQSSIATIDMIFTGTDAEGSSATTRAINRAILLSNQTTTTTESSPNKFEIARSGLRIATVILDRPLHRLGETVTAVIDLSPPHVSATPGQRLKKQRQRMSCASLRASLETTERVASELAIRSASAISRITRKVYATQSSNILFSNRAVFCCTIPVTGTPTFVTSGVNLDWFIKLEFGTVRNNLDEDGDDDDADEDDIETREGSDNHNDGDDDERRQSRFKNRPNLMEEIMRDERGVVKVAVESLECDTFEVAIPITVYGDIVMDGKEAGNEVTGVPI